MKDRIDKNPNEFEIVPVDGKPGRYTIRKVLDGVEEMGTPFCKATVLSDETAEFLGLPTLATPNDAFRNVGSFSPSFLQFVAQANADCVDAAFGKGNEDQVLGIGRQLAMYAWFRGDDPGEHPFLALRRCSTFRNCVEMAIGEIWNSQNISELIALSPFAQGILDEAFTPQNIRVWKKSKAMMDAIVQRPEAVDKIREEFWDVWKEGWQTYTSRGEFDFVVPSGVTCLTVEVVGAGGNGGGCSYGLPRASGGSGGGYELRVMDVRPGQVIHGNIPAPGENTTFGDISIATGTGAPGGYLDSTWHPGGTPSQSGKFLRVSSGGVSISGGGGGGGYGGGNGGSTLSASGGAGSGVLPITDGTGGAGGASPSSNKYNVAYGSPGTGGGGGGGISLSPSPSGNGGGGGYGGGGGGSAYTQSRMPTLAGGGGGSGCVVIYM